MYSFGLGLVLEFWLWILDLGFKVQDLGLGYKVQDPWLCFYGSGLDLGLGLGLDTGCRG